MIKVFIIDDSLMIRNGIKKILSFSSEIEVIADASNPVDAFEKFKEVGLPDVFVLDIEMPKMDGLTFLQKLKEQRPIPTIIYSSIVSEGSDAAIRALELGACDVISKNEFTLSKINEEIAEEFIFKVKAAAMSKDVNISSSKKIEGIQKPLKLTNKVIAIGSSTGGVQTLESILINLKPNHPPILITQHMPAGFTNSFAKRLNKICENSYIKEANDEDHIKSGQILIAPGDKHLEIKKISKDNYKAVLKDFPKVSNHKPSVDVLFSSFAKEVGENTIAFILTGMGKDGAIGLKKIKDIDGVTYGQDEKTSIVYGMPKVAFEMGAVNKQVSSTDIANIINEIK